MTVTDYNFLTSVSTLIGSLVIQASTGLTWHWTTTGTGQAGMDFTDGGEEKRKKGKTGEEEGQQNLNNKEVGDYINKN